MIIVQELSWIDLGNDRFTHYVADAGPGVLARVQRGPRGVWHWSVFAHDVILEHGECNNPEIAKAKCSGVVWCAWSLGDA